MLRMCLLFKDQEITPARNVLDALAQMYVCGKNDKFYYPSCKQSLTTFLHEILHVFSLLVVAELSLLPTAV